MYNTSIACVRLSADLTAASIHAADASLPVGRSISSLKWRRSIVLAVSAGKEIENVENATYRWSICHAWALGPTLAPSVPYSTGSRLAMYELVTVCR